MASPRDSIFGQRALRAANIPILEALEANSALLDRARQRFDHDSPPPYTSSTECDSEPEHEPPTLSELRELLDAPLSYEEREKVAKEAAPHYEAGAQLALEYEAELEHLIYFSYAYGINPKLTYLLKYRVTKPRFHILARAAVRKRWQALGVWNDSWGSIDFELRSQMRNRMAVRDAQGQPWAWEWKPEEAPPGETHPVWRAAHLRLGLRRGECPVPPPRTRLTSESSLGEKEAFITSRPWFQSVLSANEEDVRWHRLSFTQLAQADLFGLTGEYTKYIKGRWQQQGTWKQEWDVNRQDCQPGWKWRHESPSPEPETYLQYGQDIEQDLSPSELEEYESIEPDIPSEPPRTYWGNWHPDDDDDKQEKQPTEAPPKYTKTAAKPKSARKKTPPPRGQPPARVQKRARNSTPPVGLRRSGRAAIMQARKQEKLAAQAEKEKQLAAQAKKKKELAAQAKKEKELAAQAKKEKELAAQAKKEKELAAQAKKKELADQKKQQQQQQRRTQAAKTTTTRARTRGTAAVKKQTPNKAKTPAKSSRPQKRR